MDNDKKTDETNLREMNVVNTDLEDKAMNDDATTLMSVESAIKMNMAKINRLKEDLKPVREMMKSFLEGDEDYKKATEATRKASQLKSGRKRELLETENGKELKAKMDALKADLDDAQEALSYYLREYQRMTGLNEFEGEDGELRQIVSTVKLVRKTNLNK